MSSYIIRRILLMVPTLLGIMLLNFVIIQMAPGGPVDRLVFQLTNAGASGVSARIGAGGDSASGAVAGNTQLTRGVDPELIARIEKLYGFDLPAHERFIKMMGDYLTLDFGKSFYRDIGVLALIAEKMPVSISLGLFTTLLVYCISIPLGIRKAVRDGSAFDVITSWLIIIGYAVPGFLFAILLVILFAGGEYFNWFPLRGLHSEDAAQWPWYQRVLDYLWHITLPVTAMVISGFASLSMLTKNSFLEEIRKQYVLTAKAKGASEHQVLYGHVFRNAMLVIVAGFPSAFIKIFFTGALLIEVIFSLDGLGLLGFEAILQRDYPVVFGTLFIFTLLGMIANLLGDLCYTLIDPRIDFERRAA